MGKLIVFPIRTLFLSKLEKFFIFNVCICRGYFWQNEILALFEKYEWAVCAIGAILCMIKLVKVYSKEQKESIGEQKRTSKDILLMEYAWVFQYGMVKLVVAWLLTETFRILIIVQKKI